MATTSSSTAEPPLLSRPLLDPSWSRAPNDQFHPRRPSSLPPPRDAAQPHPEDAHSDDASSLSSEWSYTDETELVTLDLGPSRTARRILLGLSGGPAHPPLSDARNPVIRASRGLKADSGLGPHRSSTVAPSTSTAASLDAPSTSARPAPSSSSASGGETGGATSTRLVPGAGRALSLTGLTTPSPLLKIGTTILRGRRTDALGSEILLRDEVDASRPVGSQHALLPLRQGATDRATTRSTTSSARFAFVPIGERGEGGVGGEGQRGRGEELQRLVRRPDGVASRSADEERQDRVGMEQEESDEERPLALLMAASSGGAQPSGPSRSVGRPRKGRARVGVEVTEEEALVRRAERSIKREVRKRNRLAAAAREEEGQGDGRREGDGERQGGNVEEVQDGHEPSEAMDED